MVLIGILGKKRHGKDTIGEHLIKKYSFKRLAFADPLKNMCGILFDFDQEQLYGSMKEATDKNWNITPRDSFTFLGTLFRDNMDSLFPGIKKDFWIVKTLKEYKKYLNKEESVVITDVRYQNEVEHIKKSGGIIIKVVRKDIDNISTHESETEIDSIKDIDYCIHNDSTLEELYTRVDKIMDNLV